MTIGTGNMFSELIDNAFSKGYKEGYLAGFLEGMTCIENVVEGYRVVIEDVRNDRKSINDIPSDMFRSW